MKEKTKPVYAVMVRSYDCNYSEFSDLYELYEDENEAKKCAKEENENVEDEFGDGLLDYYYVKELELNLKDEDDIVFDDEKLLSLPKGLKLFYVDWDDDDEGGNHKEYVIGKTYDSAFNRWYKEACRCYYSFTYLFDEIEDEEMINEFIRDYFGDTQNDIRQIKAGIYEEW